MIPLNTRSSRMLRHLSIAICTLILSAQVHAQTLTYYAELIIDDAPSGESYKAGDKFYLTLKYDSSKLTNSAKEELTINTGITSVSFVFDGFTYDESYEQGLEFPKAYFENNKLISLDFWNSKGLNGRDANSFFRFYRDLSFQYSPTGAQEFNGTYAETSVPEPSSHLLILSSASVFLLRRKR